MIFDDANDPLDHLGWDGDCKSILHAALNWQNTATWGERRKYKVTWKQRRAIKRRFRNALSFLRSWATDKPHAMIEAMFLSHQEFCRKAEQIETSTPDAPKNPEGE